MYLPNMVGASRNIGTFGTPANYRPNIFVNGDFQIAQEFGAGQLTNIGQGIRIGDVWKVGGNNQAEYQGLVAREGYAYEPTFASSAGYLRLDVKSLESGASSKPTYLYQTLNVNSPMGQDAHVANRLYPVDGRYTFSGQLWFNDRSRDTLTAYCRVECAVAKGDTEVWIGDNGPEFQVVRRDKIPSYIGEGYAGFETYVDLDMAAKLNANGCTPRDVRRMYLYIIFKNTPAVNTSIYATNLKCEYGYGATAPYPEPLPVALARVQETYQKYMRYDTIGAVQQAGRLIGTINLTNPIYNFDENRLVNASTWAIEWSGGSDVTRKITNVSAKTEINLPSSNFQVDWAIASNIPLNAAIHAWTKTPLVFDARL